MSLLVALTAGGFIVGTLAMLAGGGGDGGEDSPNAGKRVVPPKSAKAKRAAKTVLCNCYRGGVQSFDALVACALGSIYPDADIDWGKASVEAQTDGLLHPDTQRSVRLVRKWATSLLKLQTEKKRKAWCDALTPDEDDEDDAEDTTPDRSNPPGPTPPGPTPPGPTPPGPTPPMPEPQRKAKVRELYQGVRINGKPRGEGYWRPTGGQAPTSIIGTAREVLRSYGVSPTDAQVYEYVRIIDRSDWNRGLYGRDLQDGENLGHNGKTSRTAFMPRHQNADQVIVGTARRPQRNIRNDGSKAGPGGSYGTLWLPGIDESVLDSMGIVVVDPETAEPPARLLELLDAAP